MLGKDELAQTAGSTQTKDSEAQVQHIGVGQVREEFKQNKIGNTDLKLDLSLKYMTKCDTCKWNIFLFPCLVYANIKGNSYKIKLHLNTLKQAERWGMGHGLERTHCPVFVLLDLC